MVAKGITLQHGIKIMVRDSIYQSIINDKSVMDKYILKTKRLNRWWYSIYFADRSV